MSKIYGFLERLNDVFNGTLNNKLCAIVFVELGVVATIVGEGDATGLVWFLLFAIPMFFDKRDWFS